MIKIEKSENYLNNEWVESSRLEYRSVVNIMTNKIIAFNPISVFG